MERAFRLESVLRFKRQIEEERRLELVPLEQILREEEKKLVALQTEQELHLENIALVERALVVDVGSVLQGFAYNDVLDARIAQQREVIAAAVERVETKRLELIEAVKERKILDKLKEHHGERYRAWVSHREDRVLDDQAMSQYIRAQRAVARKVE